jgi:hypothetical protein
VARRITGKKAPTRTEAPKTAAPFFRETDILPAIAKMTPEQIQARRDADAEAGANIEKRCRETGGRPTLGDED